MDMSNNDFSAKYLNKIGVRALTIAIYKNLNSMKSLTRTVNAMYGKDELSEFEFLALHTLSVRTALSMIERITMENLTPYEHPLLLKSLVDANMALKEMNGSEDSTLADQLRELERAIIIDIACHYTTD